MNDYPRQDAFVVTMLRSPLTRLAIVLGVVFLFVTVGGYIQQAPLRAQIRSQNELIAQIKKLGGHVVYGITDARQKKGLRPIDSVDLTGVAVAPGMLQQLSQFNSLRRITLDRASIQPGELRHFSDMPNLQWLSVAHTNVGDEDLEVIVGWPRISTLALSGTKVTNRGVTLLASITHLTSLDVSHTAVDAGSMPAMMQIPNLCALTLDEDCINPESIAQLQQLNRLRTLVVHIGSSDLGKTTRDLVRGKLPAHVMAYGNSTGMLWNSTTNWNETTAGVVQVVAAEMGLTPQECFKLVEAIGDKSLNRRQVFGNRPETVFASGQPGTSGFPFEPIKTFDEFIELLTLGSPRRAFSERARLFARDRVDASNLPALIDVVRSSTDQNDPNYNVRRFGMALLVRRAFDDPKCKDVLDQNLSSEDPYVRGTAIQAFGQWGEDLLYENWIPAEQIAEFGVPRLLPWATDEVSYVRTAVSDALGYLAFHHPRYAQNVLPALLEIVRTGDPGNSAYSIARIADTNIEAARQILPALNRLLESAKDEVPSHYLSSRGVRGAESAYRDTLLQAICSIVRHDATVASEFADQYLQRIRRGETHGDAIAILISDKSRAAAKTIVHELLELADTDDREVRRSARSALVRVAVAVRDLQADPVYRGPGT